MALQHKTQGFVFKKSDVLEADRVFSVFTRDFGRLEILGKAIRKINSKLRGNIEIFSFSEIEFIEGKSRKILTDTLFVKKFKNIASGPEKLRLAYAATDILDNFIKGQEKDEKIWNLVTNFFEKLENCKLPITSHQLIYSYFFWNFISILGYAPELSHCVLCRQKLNPYTLYFSNQECGIVCKSCRPSDAPGTKINSDIVKTIRLMVKGEWEIVSKLKMEKNSQTLFKKISDDYVNYLKPS